MDESTRSLLVGVLVLAKRPLAAPQIIALARALRLSATNVKSHLTRLSAEGVLVRTGARRSQCYGLSAERHLFAERIAASLAGPPDQKWTGDWVIVAAPPSADRTTRERLRAELWLDGFRPCAPGTWLRPAWPMPWAVERARALVPTALCLVGQLAGTIRLEQVQKMYGLNLLDRQSRRAATHIRREGRDVRDPAAAFRARLKIGGLAARLIAHDPRLPPEIWGRRRGLQELRQAFRSFEARIGNLADHFIDAAIGPEESLRNTRTPLVRKTRGRPVAGGTRRPAARRRAGG